MPESPLILLERDEGVAILTFNQPERRNAMTQAMGEAFAARVVDLARDDQLRAVILTGAGRAFSAGHDLKEMRQTPDRACYERLFKKCSRLMVSITRLPKPVIARVHGLATAAGCQLIASCDLAVASREAKFGTSGIRVGLFCMTPGVALSRNIARKPAFEMLFTGELISADEALALGLVNRVVPVAELEATVLEVCAAIVDNSPLSIVANKATIDEVVKDVGARDLARSEELGRICFDSADYTEGRRAFMEKRKPVWKGE